MNIDRKGRGGVLAIFCAQNLHISKLFCTFAQNLAE